MKQFKFNKTFGNVSLDATREYRNAYELSIEDDTPDLGSSIVLRIGEMKFNLTRSEFRDLNKVLLEHTMEMVDAALDARIDELEEHFGKETK